MEDDLNENNLNEDNLNEDNLDEDNLDEDKLNEFKLKGIWSQWKKISKEGNINREILNRRRPQWKKTSI